MWESSILAPATVAKRNEIVNNSGHFNFLLV